MKTLKVEVDWSRIESVPGKMWCFPSGISRHMDKHYGGPAVYRWCVMQPQQTEPHLIYVGETGSLTERIRKVVKPPLQGDGRRTNARLNQIFAEELSRGSAIVIERASFEEFSFNGVTFSQQDMSLWHKFNRCALENLLLCCCLGLRDRLLNLRIEPDQRMKKKLIANGLKPETADDMIKVMRP